MTRLFKMAAVLLAGSFVRAGGPDDDGPALTSYSRGGPTRTGAFTRARMPERPEVLWTEDTGSNAGQGVIDGDLLYMCAGSDQLVAIRLTDGSVLWQVNRPNWRVWVQPTVVGDRIYVASSLGLSAHRRADGEEIWWYTIRGGAEGSSPLVVGDLVIVGGSDGWVHAVDAKEGDSRWKTDIVADAPDDPPGFDGAKARIGDSPARPDTGACDGTNVYIPIFDQSRVVALDLKTGEKRWSFQTKGWVSGEPTVAEGKVFLGSQDHNVYALDAKTGEVAWTFETRWRADGGLAYCDGSVFVCASDGRCYRLDAKNGHKVWEYETEVGPDKKHFFLSGSPLVDASAVYFGSWDGHLYALRREDGSLKWKFKPGQFSEHVAAPITDGKRLYVPITPQFDYDAQKDKEGVHGVVAIGEAKP